MTRLKVRLVSSAALIFATALAGSVQAQESAALEEVVVTAQKRAENVQDVPISVSAFSGETLEAAGVQDIRDLRRITPSLYLATSSNTSNTRIMLRGVGTNGNTAIEPSVATFVDGVYVPRIGSMLAGLNDIGSVEVLRGPQGTLFGRNASVGAVLIRTKAPGDVFSAEGSVTVGTYGVRRVAAAADLPLADTLKTRISLLGYEGNGFGRNDLTGKRIGRNDGFSGRAAVEWTITPALTWTLRGDHQNLSGDGYNTISVVSKTVNPTTLARWQAALDPDGPAGPLQGVVPYTDDTYYRHVRQSTAGDLTDYQTGLASELTWEMAGGYQLKLISGYRDWKNIQYQASNGNTALELQRRTTFADSQNHSEELQLLSPDTLLGGRLNFVAGLYYYEEAYDIGQNIDLTRDFCDVFIRNTGTAARLNACLSNPLEGASYYVFTQDTESFAAYGQATFKLTEALSVTGGIRYSEDDKTATFRALTRNTAAAQAPESTDMALKEDKVTWRLSGAYKPSDDVMVFASYSTGFKSGGFDSAPATGSPANAFIRTFLAEEVENWELGVKSQMFDRRLVLNATLFRTDIDDLQFRSYDGLQFRTRNNGKARQQGLELETTARPIPQLTLTLGGTYLDSKYLDFQGAPGLPGLGGTQDLSGQRLPFSPKWQGAASAQYIGDLANGMSWLVRADLSFTSKANLGTAGDNNPDSVQSGYAILGGRIALRGPDQKWEVAAIGQNLTDKAFCTNIFNQPNNAAFGLNNAVTGATALRCTLNDPRQAAVEVKARF
jgi:Outer membrane receptor proteins, mostly Fe transport